jgi:transposase
LILIDTGEFGRIAWSFFAPSSPALSWPAVPRSLLPQQTTNHTNLARLQSNGNRQSSDRKGFCCGTSAATLDTKLAATPQITCFSAPARLRKGHVVLRRQVSTRWPKLEEFREQLRQLAAADEKYVAIVEVCGFHDWLVKWLQQDERCHLVLVVQPLGRSATKTDRRDAHALSELLWINRERLLRGDRVHGVRTVHLAGEEQMADRRLTAMRERLVRRRTQTLNQIHKILRRQNLEWDRPTKTFQTGKVAQWLKTLQLEPMDRLVLNQLLVQWKLWEEQIVKVDTRIGQRFLANPDAQLLATIPGVNAFIAVAITCRSEPGKFFGPDAGLPQFRRDGAHGVDYQDG